MEELPANRLRLLIIENDRVTAKDLEATLKRRGFLVVGTAYSVAQAIDLAENEEPDLALLDIQLGENNEGVDLAIELREKFELPAIFVTGYSEEALFERARKARPAAFIRKPFSDAELAACLEAVVERSLSEERLSLRLPGLEAVSRYLPQAVIASDIVGNVVYLNDAAEKLTGWSREEACRNSFTTVIQLEEIQSVPADDPEQQGDGLGDNHPAARTATLSTRNGERIEIEERSAPIKTTDGEMIGLVTVLAPQGMEDEVEEPAEPLPLPSDVEGAPPARNEALRKIAELSRDPGFRELIRKPGSQAATKQLAAGAPPPLKKVETVFSASSTPLIDEVCDPIVAFSDEGIINYANAEAAKEFSGGEKLVGTHLWSHFAKAESEKYDDQFHSPLTNDRRHRFDFHDSQRGKWFEVRAYRTKGGIMSLFTDITATRIEAAEEIRQQRLEGLGLLARGFAHDFNNHLTTLTGNISLARERHRDDDELHEMLNEAQSAASRATGLVQQLMTFARGGRPIRERSRIADLIRRVLTEHRLQHPEIRYQFQGPESELVANVDPSQISRLVENLVSNSAASMQNGGVLVVRCSNIPPEDVMSLRGSHTPSDEDHILIEVIDTGHGMSEVDLERVFEPYFTTRKENNATGIGLTVCESIAKAHGGFIQLQSKEGKGTIATFCAPVGRRPDPETPPGDESKTYPNFDIPNLTAKPATPEERESLLVGTRILILEDDAPIRRLMAATLRRAGHEVVETKDGRETVALYKDSMAKNQKFHLLICDLTIENGVGGVETMRQLLEIDPNVLSIVSSGYSDAPAMSSPASFGFRGVLPKPYAPSELRAAVHRILSAHHIIP